MYALRMRRAHTGRTPTASGMFASLNSGVLLESRKRQLGVSGSCQLHGALEGTAATRESDGVEVRT